MQPTRYLSFLYALWKAFYAYHSKSCISTPTENWTHVFMKLFIRNRPNSHLLKYWLFLPKHPVYWKIMRLNKFGTQPIIRGSLRK
jgi:hypothetical protein